MAGFRLSNICISGRVWISTVVIMLIICGTITNVSAAHGSHQNVDDELILTQNEKIAFDKFKSTVYPRITQDYLKQDLFLLRWIRSKNLNVDIAVRDMVKFLEFFRENRLATILDEDWNDIAKDHPFYTDAVDKEGRPVAYVSAGIGWKVRRAVVEGKRERLTRYMYKAVFEIMMKMVDANKKQPNVTQFVIVVDMKGYNPIQHGCAQCITSYINLLDVYERYVPGYAKEIIVINAPQAFRVMMETLRPLLSPPTGKALRVFDTNKDDWKPYLDTIIDPKYLPREFGGTKQLDQHKG